MTLIQPDTAIPATIDTSAAGLRAERLVLGYGERVAVDDVTLEIPAGRITAVIGANGCGKSTLLKGLARLIKPIRGCVHLDGVPLHRRPTRDVARRIGLLPQSPAAPEGITVWDLVARGRSPHQRWWQQWSSEDERAVSQALEGTGLSDLADRRVEELSGGQRQRAWIAMTLAQQTDILLLDEPTTFLDLAHQVEVLNLVKALNAEGRTVVMVLHDLNQAARYAHHLVALHDGHVATTGEPEQVITADMVETVFGLDAVVTPCPVSGRPLVLPR